jgi:hypothetical protein
MSRADAYEVEVLLALLAPVLSACAAITVEDSSPGRSSTSDSLSTFRDSKAARFLRSKIPFSVLLSYFSEKAVAALSKLGMSFLSASVWVAIVGNKVVRLASCAEEDMTAFLDLFESACRPLTCDCEA